MDVDVTARALILRPRAEVAGYSANPDNAPAWQTNIKSATWETAPPLAVGSVIAFTARFVGVDMAYTYEVAEYVPSEHLVMRTADDDMSRMSMETTYSWESIGPAATQMVLRNRGTVPGSFRLVMSPLMHLMMRRASNQDLKRLKRILESRKA